MEKNRLIVLILAFLVAAAGGGLFLWKHTQMDISPPRNGNEKKAYILKFGHDMPVNSAQHEAQ